MQLTHDGDGEIISSAVSKKLANSNASAAFRNWDSKEPKRLAAFFRASIEASIPSTATQRAVRHIMVCIPGVPGNLIDSRQWRHCVHPLALTQCTGSDSFYPTARSCSLTRICRS